MKQLLIVTIVLACACTGHNLNAAVWRHPPVSNAFFDHMLVTSDQAYFQTFPRELRLYEGEVTEPSSSIYGICEFFVVYTGIGPGYGAIVRLDPFDLGDDGITNNVASLVKILPGNVHVPIEVTLTNIGSMPGVTERSYLPDGTIANLYHVGSFNVDGMEVWIRIRYLGSPQSPIVDLTWGVGAGPGNPGKVSDDYDRPRLETIGRPGQTSIRLELRANNDLYVTVRAPDEGFTLEHTDNIPNWIVTLGPELVSGFNYYYHFPTPGSSDRMFFRTR